MEKKKPHVLARHFAANALLTCIDKGKLSLDDDIFQAVKNANQSPYPRSQGESRSEGGFYQGRPSSAPKPCSRFSLEYDFEKHDVDSLSRLFGKGCWEVADLISEVVRSMDSSMTEMHDDGGRESRERSSREMTTHFQGYGQQLGWHGLFIAAGNLLDSCPVTNSWWYEDEVDPWAEWLSDYTLTRQDGLWLSDGVDRMPSDAAVRLLESKRTGFAITGDQQKIMGLAGLDIDKGVGQELVIQGKWYSSDGIKIDISSALVPPQKAEQIAKRLIGEKPIRVWIPTFQGIEEDDEYLRNDTKDFLPWIVCPFGEVNLDEHDPYGVSAANFRPRLAQKYSKFCKLTRKDPFGRFWRNQYGTVSLTAQAWGRQQSNLESSPSEGQRLICKSSLLKKILANYDKDLLLLINLQRYEKETYRSSGQISHSIGVVLIDKSLNLRYYKGRVNYQHKSNW